MSPPERPPADRPGHYDVVVLGSGFAAAILARGLRRQRRKVLLIESGSHPRFALGESTTPLASLSLERIAARYRLQDLHALAAYGRWLRDLPHLRRGLLRGFSFFAHQPGEPYRNSPANEARLLIAASPQDGVADSHWLRRDVDEHLVKRAVEEGVEYVDRTVLDDLAIDDHGVRLITRRGLEPPQDISADFLVDAGPESAVARRFDLGSRLNRVPIQSGLLYGHFENVRPLAEVAPGACLGDGPFPEERAAVHHILKGAWMYQLPFDHGTTSAGLVLRPGALADPGRAAIDPEGAWREVIGRYPTLAAQFRSARATVGIAYVPRLQHRLTRAAGPRFFLLPDAYAFHDPLFATTIAWNLLAVERLLTLFDKRHGNWREYGQLLQQEADHLECLTESAYLAMDDFKHFSAVALLHSAAASFAEIHQRLHSTHSGQPDAWQGFLGATDPVLRSLCVQARDRLRSRKNPLALRPDRDFADWLLERLAPRDLYGLDQPKRPNLHQLNVALLIDRAHLLAMEGSEVFAAMSRLRGTL
jgi:FADH2 O2-dependent halogenase